MKKPFILLKRPRELLKMFICIALCLWVLTLFSPGESVPVFAQDGKESVKGLFRLVGSISEKLCL